MNYRSLGRSETFQRKKEAFEEYATGDLWHNKGSSRIWRVKLSWSQVNKEKSELNLLALREGVEFCNV